MEAKHYGCWVLGCLGAIFVEHSLIVGSHALHSIVCENRGKIDGMTTAFTVGGVFDVGEEGAVVIGVCLGANEHDFCFLLTAGAEGFY